MKNSKISKSTQDKVNAAQEEIQKKLTLVDKKIEKLKTDIKAAKKAGLSENTLNILKTGVVDQQALKKHLSSDGLKDALEKSLELSRKSCAAEASQAIEAIEKIIKGFPNSAVLASLQSFSKSFHDFEQKEKTQEEKFRQKNKNTSVDLLNTLWSFEAHQLQEIFFKQITEKAKKIKLKKEDVVPVSRLYPMHKERKKLAPLCVESARSELSGAYNFLEDEDNMSMLSMFVSDAKNHYELGVAILGGRPKDIEDKRSMDTASRDGIDEEVWHFAVETIYDGDVFGPKAMKEHREKVMVEDASKLKKTLLKGIQGLPQKKSVRRKL